MLILDALWVLFMCRKSENCEETLESLRPFDDKVTVVADKSDPLLYEVQIWYSQMKITDGSIFSNRRPETPDEPPEIGNVPAAFFLANCQIASWTMSKIFNLIKMSPLFYHRKFVFDEFYNAEYKKRFRKKLFAFLNNARLFEKFQELLTAFIFYKPNISQYRHTGIVNTVTSLLIKSHTVFLSVNDDTNSSEVHFDIVKLLVIEMIKLQRYLLLSCPAVPTSVNDSHFNGVWVSVKNKSATNDRVQKIMSLADYEFGFQSREVPKNNCSPTKLMNIVNINLNDGAFVEIAAAKVKIARDASVSIEDVVTRMKINYDVQFVYLCHEFLLNAIMKQIVVDMKEILSGKIPLDDEITKQILRIHDKLKTNFSPAYVGDGFEVLKNVGEKNWSFSKLAEDLDVYANESLNGVQFKQSDEFNGTTDKVNDSGKGQSDKILKLLQIIEENVLNFKCFQIYLTSIRKEYELYYGPFEKNIAFLFQEKNDTKLREECDFVTSVFSICNQALVLMNAYVDRGGSNDEKFVFFRGVANAFRDIKNYFLLIVQNGTDNADILKTAHDLSVMLLNFPLDSQRASIHNEVKRILNVIKNEMNGYSVKHCTRFNNHFLIFNNVDFFQFGNGDAIDRSIKIFFENNVNGASPEGAEFGSTVNENDYDYLSVKRFIDGFVKNTTAYRTYSDRVLFTWNGWSRTIKTVFEYETIIVVHPRDVYEMYVVHFKFSAAVIFFRIKEILGSTNDFGVIVPAFKTISTTFGDQDRWLKFFPFKIQKLLRSIIDELLYLPRDYAVKKLLRAVSYDEKYVVKQLLNNVESIEDKFKLLRITFADTNVQTDKRRSLNSIKRTCSKQKDDEDRDNEYGPLLNDDFASLLRELLKNVEIVFNNFSKLISQPWTSDLKHN